MTIMIRHFDWRRALLHGVTLGVGNMTVQRVVREVEAADMAESGEPVHIVARGYARRTGRRKSA